MEETVFCEISMCCASHSVHANRQPIQRFRVPCMQWTFGCPCCAVHWRNNWWPPAGFGSMQRSADVQHGAVSPSVSRVPPTSRGICIVNTEAESAVDAAAIRALGYKLRVSPSCLPPILITGKGGTIAFVLLDDTRNEQAWERIDRVHSKGFPSAFVVVSARALGSSSVDDALLRGVSRYQGKPAFVHAAPEQSFTQVALNIAIALNGEQPDSLADQKSSSLTTPAACIDALMEMPGLALEEAEAVELLQLGSLRDIVCSTAHAISQYTHIRPDRAEEIVHAFSVVLNH